ncbi:MAG: hypothetical protein GY839_12575 [candidate division Zixibacteria bacterium]|nr:hypothetical protein [candidate division Zixibacteria bacterium]
MTIKKLLPFLAFVLCYIAQANVIKIPAHYPTIQQGIESSSNGDTVLAQPGAYVENINFTGRNIILASHYLLTGDTSYISSTIIDGDSAGSVVTFESEEDSTALICGFTICNGLANNGGGIYCTNSDPGIRNNFIMNNAAADEIPGNESSGGGIYCHSSNSVIENNWIIHNYAEERGGGVLIELTNAKILNNVISNNIAFSSDSLSGSGGGIFCGEGYIIISGNEISNNYSTEGGGVLCSGINATISNNIISYNETFCFPGGGISCWNCVNYNITYNTIYSNIAASKAGGIYIQNSHGIISSNTIVSNIAASDNYIYGGGGIYLNGNSCHIYNCLIFYNTAHEGSSIFLDGGHLSVAFSNIEGGWPGESNIDYNPMFCNAADDDFHLADVSCCVGTGYGGEDIGALGIGCYASDYLLGDVNMLNGFWPPQVIGSDVTYLARYLKGLADPCIQGGYYASGDVNGDCRVIGSDVTKLRNYLKGRGSLSWCRNYPPAWIASDDLPAEAPEGWPGCE